MTIAITSGALKGTRASQPNFAYTAKLALDSSYPTGGYALAAVLAAVGCLPGHEVIHVGVEPAYPYIFCWDRTNNKLKAYVEDGGSGVTAEVPNLTDLSAVTGLDLTILSQ